MRSLDGQTTTVSKLEPEQELIYLDYESMKEEDQNQTHQNVFVLFRFVKYKS